MRQFRFSIEDICKNKSYFIRFFIQITCVLILLGFCVSQVSSINAFKSKFRVFQETSELYIIRDETEPDVIQKRFSDSTAVQSKLFELYNFLEASEDITFYSVYKDFELHMPAEKENMDIPYLQFPDDSKYYPLLFVDQHFCDIFGLSCIEGRGFSQEDFSAEKSQVPVILGYQYRGYYDIGDVIDQDYVVVGILEKDAFYLDPGKTGETLYLKGSVIAPLIVNEETPFERLDTLIASSTIITKDAEQLKLIEDKAREIELYDKLEFISFAEQLENIIENNMTLVYFALVIQCLILFFCFICIVSALMNYISTHKKEFAVHILCGACGKDLSLRIMLQVLSCLILSNMITLIIFGFSISSLVILLVSMILLLLIVVLPMIKIIKRPLASFLNEV